MSLKPPPTLCETTFSLNQAKGEECGDTSRFLKGITFFKSKSIFANSLRRHLFEILRGKSLQFVFKAFFLSQLHLKFDILNADAIFEKLPFLLRNLVCKC